MNNVLFLALGVALGAGITAVIARCIYKKQLGEALRQAKEMKQNMEKLQQMRSIFVANVTHELKTPLTCIKGYMELLRSGSRDEMTRNGFYDIIDIETERLQILIEDILQLSEIENSKDDPRQHICDLHALGNTIFDTFRTQAERAGLLFQVRIPQGLLVRGNRDRLMQLLNNLVDNAIKYNIEGGKVLLRAWHEQGATVLCVSDTGIGIPEEHLEHIFERFYRVDKGRSRAMGGTGLGLSIVKHVAQLHGGSIHVQSRGGKGTIFTIRIPD